MINSIRFLILPTLIGAFAIPAMAGDLVTFAPPEGKGNPKDKCTENCDGEGGEETYAPPSVDTAVYQEWMDPEIETAWGLATGAGVAITVVDSFSGKNKIRADLGTGRQRLLHGEWTHLQASMIAPGAAMYWDDFLIGGDVAIQSGVFNVLNLSYGWIGDTTSSRDAAEWLDANQEMSILTAASNDAALISKSAGNDGDLFGNKYAVGEVIGTSQDFLSAGLIDVIGEYRTTDLDGFVVNGVEYAPIIFAGSLDAVGYTGDKASLSYYSNIAGSDVDVQDHYMVVGVNYGLTDLAGTSFAAPIISGYAALVAEKFTTTTFTPAHSQVAAQLLTTAREDTINGYSRSIHGQGEACIACAIGVTSLR